MSVCGMTETEAWLRNELNVSKQRAWQYRDLPLADVQAEMLAEIGETSGEERQKRIGRVLLRWESRPPRPPQLGVDWSAYARDQSGLFRLGSDTSDLDCGSDTSQSPPPNEPQTDDECFKEAYRRARAIAPTGTSHRAMTALIQADRYGTSVGQALRVMAEEGREGRMMDAEKKAASLPPKLTVPLILFFLPVLFIVIMAPAMIKVFCGPVAATVGG